MVNWTTNKLGESCGQEESGIKAPCLCPQSYCWIHVEKLPVPTGQYVKLSSPLESQDNCWGFRPANFFLLPLCEGYGTDTAFIDVKAKTHTITGGGPRGVLTDIWKERVTERQQPY